MNKTDIVNSILRISILGILLLFSACEFEPEFDVDPPDDMIVVDGWIEHGKHARVLLTRNSPYFTTIDSASIRELVLSRATVSLTSGDQTEFLILRKDTSYFPPFYFAGNEIIGESGGEYTLTASFGGSTVTATTSIPSDVRIDTTFFIPLPGSDTLGQIALKFTDPGSKKNYYRIMTRRHGKDKRFIPSFITAINDVYFPGEQIQFSLYRAPESFFTTTESEYYHIEDTVIVKLLTMDEDAFIFWNSYQEEVINTANPFASSLRGLKSNVSENGLGIWCGYGVSIDTIYH